MRCGSGRGRGRFATGLADTGMVTAELALAIPTLLFVVALGAFAVSAATARIRCIDAAASIARMVARGEATDVVLARERQLGARSHVTVARSDGLVRVDVSTRVPVVGAWRLPLPPVTVAAESTVVDEAAS